MDPSQLAMIMQMLQQRGGMFGGTQQMQPQSQMPQQMPQMQPQAQPQPQPQDGQLPAMGDPQQQHHGGGFNPLMMISPMGYMLAKHPKYALAALSPGIGMANLLGAFK